MCLRDQRLRLLGLNRQVRRDRMLMFDEEESSSEKL